MKLVDAEAICDAALAACDKHGFMAIAIAVIDAGGNPIVVKRADCASPYRIEIAQSKAAGCIGMGMGGRTIAARAGKMPAFYAAVTALRPLIPVPGGVLIRDAGGAIIGAVGISGDTSDNDELCAIAGIAAAGLIADTGDV